MKTAVILLSMIGLAIAGYTYRNELAAGLEKLKRVDSAPASCSPSPANGMFETNQARPDEPVVATSAADRFGQIVAKMNRSLNQMDKPLDTNALSSHARPDGNAQSPAIQSTEAAEKYDRLWQKLQRNQHTVNP